MYPKPYSEEHLRYSPREPLSNTQHDPLTSGALLDIFVFCQRMFSFFYSINLSPGRMSLFALVVRKLRIKCETSF